MSESPAPSVCIDGDHADIQAEVTSLTRSFLERTQSDVVRLRRMVERLRLGEAPAILEVERLAHSIHGTSAIFGFPRVSAAAGLIESWARDFNAHTNEPGPSGMCALLEPLLEHIQRLARATEAADQTTL